MPKRSYPLEYRQRLVELVRAGQRPDKLAREYEPEDIACWLVDTRYDGKCLQVRHAYFMGSNDLHIELRRALRAEIDVVAWATLCGTTSHPFSVPSTGKFAVKVIDYYGDEVMKVFAVSPSSRRRRS